MKKILLSLALVFGLSTSALATVYTQDQPDCTKTSDFSTKIRNDGFVPILSFPDKLNPSILYIFLNNAKTSENMIVSVNKDTSKICLVTAGSAAKLEGELSNLRDFLNEALVTTTQGK
jgi:hypothetical protein